MNRQRRPTVFDRTDAVSGALSRRRLVRGIAGLGLAAAAWPLVAGCGRSAGQEQPPARVARVGLLFGGSPEDWGIDFPAIRQAFAARG